MHEFVSPNTPNKIRASTIPLRGSVSQMTETDIVINERISRALENGFGPAVRKAMFWNLERDFGINEKNAAENPDRFVMGLEKLLGPVGREFLVRLISKELIEEFELSQPADKSERSFSEIIFDVRKKISAQN